MKSTGKPKVRPAWMTGVMLALALVMSSCGPETYYSRFLVSWSPDCTRAVAVTNLLEESPDSGMWIFEAGSDWPRQIVALNDGRYCIHPQWSPFDDEILFATVTKDPEETRDPADITMPYSVWVIGADGYGLRKIADCRTIDSPGDSNLPTLALPNSVAWGAEPGTVIIQSAVGDKVTALLFDPYTGRLSEFLPHPADAYSLEPSPSRRQVAALLYDNDAQLAEVFVADFGFGNWRNLAVVGFEADQLNVFSPMIFWSPDSSCFVVLEEQRGFDGASRHYLRLFDARTCLSPVIAAGNPNTGPLWDRGSDSLLFSASPEDGDSDSFIYRVDRSTGRTIPIVSQGDNFLISWNWETQRVYFYRRFRIKGSNGSEEATIRRLFSCRSDGSDMQDLGPWIDGESWCVSPGGRGLIAVNHLPQFIDLNSYR